MSQEKLDVALAALKDLVVDVLDSTESNRFARASTLAALASKIAAQGALGLETYLRGIPHG